MEITIKPQDDGGAESMEQRLSRVGARIDVLIAKASEARSRLDTKLHGAREAGGEAADELKIALDRAWEELNQAWGEIKEGTERAARKLQASECCKGSMHECENVSESQSASSPKEIG